MSGADLAAKGRETMLKAPPIEGGKKRGTQLKGKTAFTLESTA